MPSTPGALVPADRVPVPHPDRVAVTTVTQWLQCAHLGTALDLESGDITLAEDALDPAPGTPGGPLPAPAGLSVDPGWRVYHAVPEQGRIERARWSPNDVRRPVRDTEDLLRTPAPAVHGGFTATSAAGGLAARAVAVDADGRLLVLDDDALWAFDLATRQQLRRVVLPAPPVDLAVTDEGPVVAVADRARPLWRADPRRGPRPWPVPARALAGIPDDAAPTRVAADPHGRVWVLYRDGAGTGWLAPVADARRTEPLGPFPDTGDVELDGTGALVIAGPPGATLRRIVLREGTDAAAGGLRAGGYDGRGLARTPDGRIAYWAGRPRIAYAVGPRYRTTAHVTTIALDSGEARRTWGRVFVDACLPAGTSLGVEALTADALPDPATTLPRTPPVNVVPEAGTAPGPSTGPSAPLPDAARAARLGAGAPVHRRERPELPWLPPDPPRATFEAPVDAPPGRYLWLRITLHGTPTASPRVHAVRVETRAHDLLDRLPRVFADEPDAASFLHRYLGIVDGLLSEVADRAVRRDLLLAPAAAPPELLGWLASLVGLSLDDRWPVPARRTLIAEAVPLLRRRGTVGSLTRMLEIYLGTPPVLVERFRFRGLDAASADGPAVLGGGFRVGGTLGRPPVPSPTGGAGTDGGAFEPSAHRFSIIVPRPLSPQERAAVDHLLELHRPAHTLVDVCTVDAGMRVGVGLHLGLTSIVGPTGGFRPAQLGASTLGRDAVVGPGRPGIRVAASRLGADSRVGS